MAKKVDAHTKWLLKKAEAKRADEAERKAARQLRAKPAVAGLYVEVLCEPKR